MRPHPRPLSRLRARGGFRQQFGEDESAGEQRLPAQALLLSVFEHNPAAAAPFPRLQ